MDSQADVIKVTYPTVAIKGTGADQQYVSVTGGTGVVASNGSMKVIGRNEVTLVEMREPLQQTLDIG